MHMLGAGHMVIKLSPLAMVFLGGGLLSFGAAVISAVRSRWKVCVTQVAFALFLAFLAYVFRA